MKSIVTILGGATALTALLADGTDSIFTFEAKQGAPVPHLVVDVNDVQPIDGMNHVAEIDLFQIRVFSISDRPYSKDGNPGAQEIAEQVRQALDGVNGTNAGEVIADIRLLSVQPYQERHGRNVRVVYESIFEVYKNRLA